MVNMSSLNNDPISCAEIRYNLNIMKETLQKGKIVDPVFMDIFQDAIASLPADQQPQLTRELAVIGKSMNASFNHKFERVNRTANQEVFGVENRPEVGEKIDLSVIANEYQLGDTKTALTNLAVDYDCRRIRGDGHCQFRSIGTGFLLSCQNMTEEAKRTKIDLINQRVESLVGNNPQEPLNTLKAPLFESIMRITPQNADQLVRNKNLSDNTVEFLRFLSAEQNFQHPSETFLQMLEQKETTLEDYCNGMERMDLAWEGGEPELCVISNCLDLKLVVLDVTVYNEANRFPARIYNEGAATPEIHLLYRPRHYDLLVEK